MTKQNEITILSANLNFYNSENKAGKTSQNIVNFLLSEDRPKPTFIALQEVGNRLLFSKTKKYEDSDRSVNIDEIEKILNDKGYGVIRPKQNGEDKDGGNPVNTRLFYLKELVESVKELSRLGFGKKEDFYNRQCGSVFTINNQAIAIYSLHFPWKKNEREAFWQKYIELAIDHKYDHLILAGDFNESLGNENESTEEPVDKIKNTELSHKLKCMTKYMIDASLDLPTWDKKKLDHIFVTPNTTINSFSTHRNDYSDHQCLIATFTI